MLKIGFSIIDYIVFCIVLLISFVIGIFHAFKSNNNYFEFVMGKRSFGVVPTAMSLCASFNSGFMILGIPYEVYSYGTQFLVTLLGIGLGVIISAEIWIPILHRLKLVSIYEYFERRYCSNLPRRLLSAIFIFKTLIYLGVVLYGPTAALNSVSELPWWVSILLLGACSTTYTALGGIQTIIWTDVFQIIVIITGLLAIVIKGLTQTGSFANVLENALAGGRVGLPDFSADVYKRETFWSILFGSAILWGSPYTSAQYLVHRSLCLKSLKKAKASLYLNYIGQVVLFMVVTLIGILLYAYYINCDPVNAGVIKKGNALVSLFVLQELSQYYGIPGVFISCLFSGSLSTFDSAIHSMAVVTVEELLTLKRFRFMSEKQKTTVTKYICVFYGMAAMSTALALPSLSMFLTVAGTFLGATLGPMFAYIVVSVTMPFVNLKGSMVGLCSGLVINIWLSAGSTTERLTFPRLPLSMDNCSLRFPSINGSFTFTEPIPNHGPNNKLSDVYRMSHNIYPIIGFGISFIVCILGSFLTGGFKEMKYTNKKHFNPTAWKLFQKCFPKDLEDSKFESDDEDECTQL